MRKVIEGSTRCPRRFAWPGSRSFPPTHHAPDPYRGGAVRIYRGRLAERPVRQRGERALRHGLGDRGLQHGGQDIHRDLLPRSRPDARTAALASGGRLPIVMAEVNRALAPGWNIWMDQTDSLAQRDTGWIQFYCEDGQEVLDTTLMAFKLAESVNLPVMVVLDAFFLSHTFEPVDIPDQQTVDEFLPPFEPRISIDFENPCNLYQMAAPSHYMEMRYSIQQAMEMVQDRFQRVEEQFHETFGRQYGPVEAVQCEDADVVLVMAGTAASTCRHVVSELRKKGEKAGLLKMKMFRPFPSETVRKFSKT